MHLSKLTVKDYKSLRDTSLGQFARVTALIGANNSGKSAILQALAFVSLIAGDHHYSELSRGADEKDWFRDVSTDHDERAVEVTIGLTLSRRDQQELEQAVPGIQFGKGGFGNLITATFDAGSADSPRVVAIRQAIWSFRGRDFLYVSAAPDAASVPELKDLGNRPQFQSRPASTPISGLGGHGLGSRTEIPRKSGRGSLTLLWMIGDWLANLRWLGPERSFATAAAINMPPDAESTALSRELQHLLNNDRPTFEAVERIMGELVPGTEKLLAPINEANSTTSTRVVSENVDYALIHGGHGVSSMLKMIVAVEKAALGATVLIEEPETALHAGAQRAVANVLERVARERELRLLVTTHSSIFARDNEDFATILVTATDNGTVTRSVTRKDFALLKRELGAQNSDLFMANMVLFVEDTGADQFYPTVFGLCDFDLDIEGIHVIPLHGVSRKRLIRLKEYLEYLRGSDVRSFVVLDDDKGVTPGIESLVKDGLLAEDDYWIWKKDGRPAEFEDSFGTELLVDAANALAEEAGREAKLNVAGLDQMAGERGGTMISEAVLDYYRDTYDYRLSKVKLASRLADLLAESPDRLPEPVIELVERVKKRLRRKS